MSECFVVLGIMAQYYQTTSPIIPGSNYAEVRKKALIYYSAIEKQTKRRPYIRSVYFKKQKVFFDYFWIHLAQKNHLIQTERLKYLLVAVELLKYSHVQPEIKNNPNKKNERFYRFFGITKSRQFFGVQIKENLTHERKFLMSVFPIKKSSANL